MSPGWKLYDKIDVPTRNGNYNIFEKHYGLQSANNANFSKIIFFPFFLHIRVCEKIVLRCVIQNMQNSLRMSILYTRWLAS